MIKRVGVIGLGNMGKGVAKNFAKSRWPLVVWDLDPEKRRPFAAMENVEIARPADMAKICSAIVFLVPATPEIRACTDGKDGIFNNARAGLLLLDLTASDPCETQKLAREAARRKVWYIDAGTSGGPTRADSGELLLMVGGDRRAASRAREYMHVIAKHIYYLGASGAGHTLKLIHNNLCFTTFLATCEACRQAEHSGFAIGDAIEIFNKSNARSYASEERFPRHILNKKWDGRSSIYLLYKDLKLGVDLCKRLGADSNLATATLAFIQRSMVGGMSDDDYTLLYRNYEKIRKMSMTGRGLSKKRAWKDS